MKPAEHYHFVTGKLAEASVRSVVDDLASQLSFAYTIQVMPITVAALMTGRWMLRHLQLPPEATRLVLPGYLQADLDSIRQAVNEQSSTTVVECGPRNILDLPRHFGKQTKRSEDYGSYDIEIIAEINHANLLPIDELCKYSLKLVKDGADVIDLGCTPGHPWSAIGQAVRELNDRGVRVSVDSFDPIEVQQACQAGAELVLSVNSSNRHLAIDWGCEVVVIPDSPEEISSLYDTAKWLDDAGVRYRLDPILQPLGLGLAASLERYAACRREFPHAPLMMGIGNITELTDCDSAGINTLLLGICQELRIQSVLTTQVINWSRSSVRECDLARRLVYYASRQNIPPKHLEPRLVMLRDPSLREFSEEAIAKIGAAISDNNFRIFTAGGRIHAVTGGLHVAGDDPFEVMQQVLDSPIGSSIDATHAFYLGFEMCKALQALILAKTYEQDQALQWGYLTRPEPHWRLKPPRP